jgi:hypothetical protein
VDADETCRALLTDDGRTFVAEAALELADEPEALYRLLVLVTLASTRIRAAVAAGAARELWAQGRPAPLACGRRRAGA